MERTLKIKKEEMMRRMKRIAVGGSAANPPHIGHLALLDVLLKCKLFDVVIWILSGDREDKQYFVTPDDRVAMTELTLPKKWRFRLKTKLIVKYDDVYFKNTPTIIRLNNLKKQYPDAKITWYTGSDSVVPLPDYGNKCEIEAKWHQGKKLMKEWPFLIIRRRGYLCPRNLPPNFKVLGAEILNIASSDIVERIRRGKKFEHLVTPDVAEYIKAYGLYGYKNLIKGGI